MPDQLGGGTRGEVPDERSSDRDHAGSGRRAGRSAVDVGGRWRLRNWRLRTKVAAVLLVPMLTAVALGWLRVEAELGNADAYQRTVDQVDAARQVTAAVHELQKERALVVARAARGSSTSLPAVQDQEQRTNSAIADLRDQVSKLDIPDAGSRDRYDRGVDRLGQLTALRSLAETGTYPDLAILDGYNNVIDTLVQLGREVTAGAGDQTLYRASTAAQTLDQAKEHAAQLDALFQIVAAHSSFQLPSTQNKAQSEYAAFAGSVADFLAVATPDERQSFSDGYSGPDVDHRQRIWQTSLLSADPTSQLLTDFSTLTDTSASANDKLRKVETGLIGELHDQAATLTADARAAALRDSLILFVALLGAFGLMLVIVWSLLSPLRRLRLEALDIANNRLPETVRRILADANPVEAAKNAIDPVPVYSSEEIGQLARSFDRVHEQAVRMATDQAVLRDNVNAIFVNLSRRSQLLVERQLSELDKLEQNEQDPDQLARFFVLDHLATRMRRNSENLIILSGTGLSSHLARPVPVSELVQAAISEVEHYERVKLSPLPDVLIHGRAIKDLVHLIAELLDNATTFSQPDTTVSVGAKKMRGGALALQISDDGIGMSEEEIRVANERLADPPDIDISVSRRMGLYVVARLAKRHNIQVRLQSSEFIDGGTRAIITVPADLLAPSPERAPELPSRQNASVTTTGGRTPKLWLDAEPTGNQPTVTSQRPDLDQGQTIRSGRKLLQDAPPEPATRRIPVPEPEPIPEPPAPEPQSSSVDLFKPWTTEPNPDEAVPDPIADEATAHLPIYEEVLSQWFQADPAPRLEDAPAVAASGPAAEASPAGAEGPRHEQVERPADRDSFTQELSVPRSGSLTDPPLGSTPETATPAAPATTGSGLPRRQPAATPRSAWTSPADDGWQTVRSRLAAPPSTSLTEVGLPKRVPKAQLVPGSAPQEPSMPSLGPDQGGLPDRSPERIRSRLANFQQGLGRARRGVQIGADAAETRN